MENTTSSTEEVSGLLPLLQFAWIDYASFVLMFVLSVAIGVYYGFFAKQETAEDYLLGGRTMRIFPIAMSLIASHLSGVTLLGVPAEIYYYGIQYWICVVSGILCSIIVIYVYLPVLYELKISSSYEYLKIRFDGNVRTVASLIYVISTVLHIPIIIYIPALALNQVTGFNVHYTAPAVCAVCIFYTTIGGLRAVVWTDTLQFMVTIASMLTVLAIGIYSAGGFGNIWKISEEGGRTSINMDLDPTTRSTFWGVAIGMTVMWVSNFGVNPSSVQRFLAVPSLSAAKRSVVIFGAGVLIAKSISCFSGLIMYAIYSKCDPLKAGLIKRKDQLLAYYVLDVAGHIFGLPGLFISGVFSTALSTLSANLNTLSGTIYEDFVLPILKNRDIDLTEKQSSNVMKTIVVVVGCVCVVLIFVIENLGGVLQVNLSFHGMTAGPLLGLFTLGMLFRKANAKGALWGGIASLLTMTAILIGFHMSLIRKQIRYPMKPTSTEGCNELCNITLATALPSVAPSDVEHSEAFWIFRISYYWYALMGASIVILVGLPVSWATSDKYSAEADLALISPVIRWFYAGGKAGSLTDKNASQEYAMVPQSDVSKPNNIVSLIEADKIDNNVQ